MIQLTLIVKCYPVRIPQKTRNFEFYMLTGKTVLLCDDNRPCLGLPPYTAITPLVERLKSVEPISDTGHRKGERNVHCDLTSESWLAPNPPDFADKGITLLDERDSGHAGSHQYGFRGLCGFLRFSRKGPHKGSLNIQSLRGRSFTTALSQNKLLSLRGALTAPSKIAILRSELCVE
ncbi:hypothetical protein TNCV_2704841 [Trichonephila clavipes]|nr:hypothetical protein TNCV_2704841 [Trichonephila clavipes]